MARYYFHLQNDVADRDLIGTDLPDTHSAKCHAVQYLAEYLCHQPHVFWDSEIAEVTVTDEAGLTLLVVSMVATLSPVIAPQRQTSPT